MTNYMTTLLSYFYLQDDVLATLKGLEGDSQQMMFNKGAKKTTDIYKTTLDAVKIDSVFQECGVDLRFHMEMDEFRKIFN